MELGILIAFGLYFTIIGAIGFIAYWKSSKSVDFALGSRSLSYWVTALAAHASDMSGWLFLAFPAAIYEFGLIKAWVAVGLTIFMYLNWQFVAKRLRILTEKYKSSTLSSFFQERFNDQSGMLRIVSALFGLLFFTFYISANLVILGTLFESIFNISYTTGIFIGSFVVFYILLGGFLSIAWIDFFQGIFLMAMIIIVPAVAYFKIGGINSIITTAHQNNIPLSFFPQSWKHLLDILFVSAGWGLGYFGQPHIITKFMGIKNVDDMDKAKWVGISWQAISLTAAVCVGLIGIAYFPEGLAKNELLFVYMTKDLFTTFFAGIILCAILASSINVMGGQILASASILGEDFYKYCIHEKNHAIADYRVQMASRLSVLLVCAIAFVLAFYNHNARIYDLTLYAWTGLGCSFGPLVLVALHTKMQNRYAALAGIITGGTIAAFWHNFDTTVPPMVVGFAGSLLAMFLVACLCKEKVRN